MIEREARDVCSRLLRRLVARQITGDEFEDRAWELRSEDPAIDAVVTMGWCLYTESCRVDRRTSKSARPDVARVVLFLTSNLEYRWPPGGVDQATVTFAAEFDRLDFAAIAEHRPLNETSAR